MKVVPRDATLTVDFPDDPKVIVRMVSGAEIGVFRVGPFDRVKHIKAKLPYSKGQCVQGVAPDSYFGVRHFRIPYESNTVDLLHESNILKDGDRLFDVVPS